VVLVLLSAVGLLRGPNLGIEFTGGSEFQVAGVSEPDRSIAREIVRGQVPGNEPNVTVLGQSTVRVQTEQLDSTETAELAESLAEGSEMGADAGSTSCVGPGWRAGSTQTRLQDVVGGLVL